jgi:membrane protein implicated in regulation of membrane protease activity
VFLLVALALLLLAPSPWDVVGFVAGLVLFGFEVAFWNRRVRGHRKMVGTETLIGRQATVVSACRPDGQVRVGGEVWAARCAGGASVGDTVTVGSVDGLTLVVSLVPVAPDST